ncbi:COG1470 family protein [Spirilliplanes yamanashiensis]|uniref:Hydrolytic protein n=1 Tax=Spirilliplanes yamanashiensis TaxID=42233 RepID=A0A8J3Y9J2_9ACTN|nr:hypothetical protein [Spirilliplanes yamanashiensis]MDP9815445.1 hypothetical protein [Spirilliplanes yamanashiensis]GIJ03700.1 hypothetical protein Sya03_30520 [Spirilliplanes yamanashiensis]
MAWGTSELTVVPGEEAVLTATVRNTGQVIDQVTCAVVGAAAPWTVVEPAVLNLYPGDSAEVRVHFRPPRAAEPAAGPVPFGFKALSLEDPEGSVVEEGVVDVAPFSDLRVTLVPQISRGARKGKHRVDIANLGNVAVGTEIEGVDQDDALTFTVSRSASVVGPGLVHRVRLAAVPREKFWTGAQRQRPFDIVVMPDRGEAVTSSATFEQDPVVPRWALGVAVAVIALAVVGAGLWLAVLKPAVQSAATEAAKVESSKAAEKVKNDTAAQLAAGGGAGPGGGGPGGDVTPSPSKKPTPDPSAAKALTKAVDYRISAAGQVRASGFSEFFDAKQPQKPLDVSDIVLQNPVGDVGLLEIRRGDETLLTWSLETHRIQDQHFSVPLHFNKGQRLTIAVRCQNPAPAKKKCSAAVTVSGRTTP